MPDDLFLAPAGVLLVDDQPAILAGVGALIASEASRLRLVGRAARADQALELARLSRPDVIVLDVDLAGEDGLALIPALRAVCSAAIIVFTCLAEPGLRRHAVSLGAAGFVPKTAPGEELLAAILAASYCGRRPAP